LALDADECQRIQATTPRAIPQAVRVTEPVRGNHSSGMVAPL